MCVFQRYYDWIMHSLYCYYYVDFLFCLLRSYRRKAMGLPQHTAMDGFALKRREWTS